MPYGSMKTVCFHLTHTKPKTTHKNMSGNKSDLKKALTMDTYIKIMADLVKSMVLFYYLGFP